MQPARAVSPEAAALLPPVGLLSWSRTPPPLAANKGAAAVSPSPAAAVDAPAAAAGRRADRALDAAPLVTPTRQIDVQKKWAAAGRSSAAWTIMMVVTAVGVGAMAIVPLLGGGGEPPEVAVRPNASGRGGAVDPSGTPDETTSLRDAGPRPAGGATGNPPATTRESSAPDPQREARLESELASITRLLRERNTAAAQDQIERLAAEAWPTPLRKRVESHSALASAIEAFLATLQEALDRTGAGHTITWRGREAPIVGVSDTTVTILVNLRQVRLQRGSLSDEAVRALAEGVLDMDDPRNLAHLGAFLFVVEEGGHAQARRLWSRAASAGEDVTLLMGLLRP